MSIFLMLRMELRLRVFREFSHQRFKLERP